MSLLKKLSYTTATAALVAMASAAAVHAQVTTTEIRGSVVDASGAPVSGATVQVIHQPTGTSSTTTTGTSGSFSARGLRPGGPYIVVATAAGYQGAQAEDLYAQLGSPLSVNIALESGAGDTIVVTGSRLVTANVAVGPSTVFDAADLANSPAINRDLKDIVRLDPRVYLDESFNDSIQCAGAHPRFNSLTVDGIGLNDGFGLNSNGYPTERMPFPYDAINQVSVELAPFDVQYGGFTACNINAVTRSGTNEFTGSAFYDYTDDNLQGAAGAAPFDEQRYGFSFGGPIIQDRLFFYGSYERFEGINQFFRGPEGSGATVEVAGFTQAEYDQILNIAQTVYQFNPGGIPQSAAAIDEKYLIRLDWNITNNHRASLTYNYSEGLNRTESDGDNNEFEYENHLYDRGAAPLEAYALQVFSDWTDNFSTEVRLAFNSVDFQQASVNGTDVGEIQIRDGANTIYLGADDSRHSNALNYDTMQIRLAGSYDFNDHLITAGYERLTFDIFNLFVQHTEGEFRFNNITDFQNGIAARVYYGNARGTNNPADAGASFSYDVHTLYAQDEFRPHPDVNITAGLRYEWYTSSDRPNENANFIARNGFTNAFNLDGVDLLQPRLGFEWDVNDALSVRGGLGLYSGGNPNVWVSNSYSNDGITNIQLLAFNVDLNAVNHVQDEGGQGRPLWGIPQGLFDGVANGAADSTVNAIDPNFETPSEWKFAIGATYDFDMPFVQFEDQTRLLVDVLYSQSRDGVLVRDIALEQVGAAAADGRPVYRRIDRSDPDCVANPGTIAAPNPACTYRGFNNDLLLTNSEGGRQFVFSAVLSQEFANDIDLDLGYAYTDSTDVNPMTSSVAFSNWVNIATSDINNPGEATSNYEIPHRFTMRLSWQRAFFGEYMTRATLFGQAFQARPYSWSFGGNTNSNMFGDNQEYVHLLYVPLANDPNVTYGPNFDQAAFNAFIDQYGLSRGQIVERNGEEGSWSNKFDLRLEQEFRGILPGHTSSAFLVVENIGNLINEDWGIISQAGFPQRIGVVDASLDANGRYTYTDFFAPTPERVVGDVSFWTVRMGLRYEF